MTSGEWEKRLGERDLYGSLWKDVIADLAACEKERDEMDNLNAVLSAGQCCVPPYITGDDYGNAVCPLRARVKVLEGELELVTAPQPIREKFLRDRVKELQEALEPFAATSECGTGLIVGEDEEHTSRCYECQSIMAARAALGKEE